MKRKGYRGTPSEHQHEAQRQMRSFRDALDHARREIKGGRCPAALQAIVSAGGVRGMYIAERKWSVYRDSGDRRVYRFPGTKALKTIMAAYGTKCAK